MIDSSTKDSGEGSDPEGSSQQSIETEIIMCVEEIQSLQGVASKSKKWCMDYGFEETDHQNSGRKVDKVPRNQLDAVSEYYKSMIHAFY